MSKVINLEEFRKLTENLPGETPILASYHNDYYCTPRVHIGFSDKNSDSFGEELYDEPIDNNETLIVRISVK